MGRRSMPVASETSATGSPKRGAGTKAGAGVTTAPLDRPWISPAGIKKAFSPAKPTTSASTGAWCGICT
ncbi:hypothetical protein D3C85_1421660 [compost metagenome]